MISIWDDHEFSDDCWGDNGTYFNSKTSEVMQTPRREAAERAHFEFMPNELGLSSVGELAVDGVPISDPNTSLYRDFRFGQHLHLLMTDTRTYRPDHAIAEDAFYATVILTQSDLEDAGLDPNDFDAYVDIDDAAYA